MHTSVKLNTPIEFINLQPTDFSPLISKTQIKVCWVDDNEFNRNRTKITKKVATEMASSLRGSPIVGLYCEETQDFLEHEKQIVFEDGELRFKELTRPYGFVDLNAKVWFQKFLDDESVEREYLMTEGYIWTGQYPESKRIIERGNNQSMELDKDFTKMSRANLFDSNSKFFIINETIISKLCILGEEEEPCFEGASIGAPSIEFSFDDGFKEQLFSMMNEIKELLDKGGKEMFTRYAVEVGDALWTALYSHISDTYSNEKYSIINVCKDEEEQVFAVVKTEEDKLYRLNISLAEETYSFSEMVELESWADEAEPQFSVEEIEKFLGNFNKIEEDKIENPVEEQKVCPECNKPIEECTCEAESEEEKEEEKTAYCLEEIPEYVELQNKYSALELAFNELKAANELTVADLTSLKEFKKAVETKEKRAMIDSFYMLSDEDKQDVIDNIDTYSIDDIEAKLSIICVRNKVNFGTEDDDKKSETVTYSLHHEDDCAPAWVKAVRAVSKDM